MRHLLIAITLIVTALAGLPGAAQAHDRVAAMAQAMDCAGCDDHGGAMPGGTGMDHPCQHGVACSAQALPVAAALPLRTATTLRRADIEAAPRPRSTLPALDLPPPRT